MKTPTETVGDPVLVADGDANIILMNRDAESLFAPSGPESDPRGGAPQANTETFTELVDGFLREDAERCVDTVELVHPRSRSGFQAEVVSSKILNPRGEPTAIVSVIHDRTHGVENGGRAELRQVNEELEDRIRLASVELEERNRRLEWQSRELERAYRLKSEFLASMSHELRTPINAVMGYTSLLREEIYGALTDKQKDGLDKVNLASQHLLDLINDILDLSRIEAGKMPVYVEAVSLRSVIGDLVQAVAPLSRDKGIDVTADIEEDLPELRTDPTKLKQILLNLLSNAVKFTSEGGVILAARRQGEDRVLISVVDTGIGIKEEDLDGIFEDFRQVDQSPTREYGGTGLGLSITRKLVSLLDGDIAVESTYGVGTTFEVELPIRLGRGTQEEQLGRALGGAGEPDPEGSPSSD